MANNYLRYKYYLITRAAADEIYTAVQEIFMKMGVKPGAETAPSQKAAIHFTNTEEMKINASVAELLKHGAFISLKGGATGDMKVSDSTGEEARIGTAFDLLSEMKLNSAHSSAIDGKTAYCLAVTAKVMKKMFYPDIPVVFDAAYEPTFEVGDSVITGHQNKMSFNMRSDAAKLSAPIETEARSENAFKEQATVSEATPINHEAQIGVLISSQAAISFLDGISSAIDEKTAYCLKMGVTMFRRTILADFDEKQLSEMDIKTLSQLLYVENTN